MINMFKDNVLSGGSQLSSYEKAIEIFNILKYTFLEYNHYLINPGYLMWFRLLSFQLQSIGVM